jgi:hypothetical protein
MMVGDAIMTNTATQINVSSPVDIAAFIHNDILQSLGVAVLGVDLCRRLHQKLRYDDALAEIDGMSDAITLALSSSLRLLPALQRQISPAPPSAPRPNLMRLNDIVGATGDRLPTLARPAADTHEIVETLTVCQILITRCRSQYDAGLGDDTMRDLDVLQQRLDFVSVAFREIMDELRRRSTQPFGPQPRNAPAAPLTWIRSA